MKEFRFWQVDAFTKEKFKGNPAAVLILEKELDDQLMQNIAVEMNLSETAYVLLRPGQNPYLRWFTPMSEIDLCGHATLASAQIYFNEIDQASNEITFDTKFAGPLRVKKNNSFLTMNFPSRPGDETALETIPDFVLNSLSSIKPIYARKSRDLMLVYKDEKTILNMKPNFNNLIKYKDFIIVTAESKNEKYDFISRFFCAGDGIAEDPVTGSAHSTLTPYWSNKLNKTKLVAYQASKRGGELNLEYHGDRIDISGQAITIINGIMTI
tara:strand:- start:1696 stop:2499 length:804 start_codon:yes stop_codon:yes gene_type:complete